jgi:hypothetical protein
MAVLAVVVVVAVVAVLGSLRQQAAMVALELQSRAARGGHLVHNLAPFLALMAFLALAGVVVLVPDSAEMAATVNIF